jgi:hypothetical protein
MLSGVPLILMLSNGMRNIPSKAMANTVEVDGLVLLFRGAS